MKLNIFLYKLKLLCDNFRRMEITDNKSSLRIQRMFMVRECLSVRTAGLRLSAPCTPDHLFFSEVKL